MATPHRGSPWAERPIGRWASKQLQESPQVSTIRRQLVADNPGVFSQELQERTPNTIDLLETSSALLQAIDRLPPSANVQAHSIIGNGYCLPCTGSSDVVVPVASAQRRRRELRPPHEDADVGEHGQLKRDDKSLEELFCILRRHLMELGL